MSGKRRGMGCSIAKTGVIEFGGNLANQWLMTACNWGKRGKRTCFEYHYYFWEMKFNVGKNTFSNNSFVLKYEIA